MANSTGEIQGRGWVRSSEWRFVLVGSLVVLTITCIPYVLGALQASDERVFGGMVYAVEDGYSYLAKMRQGAEGAWLFHIPYTPESHSGSLFYLWCLLLGKVAALLPWGDLTTRLVWVFHSARVVFGFVLLVTVYRFLADFTERVDVRRMAWLMVALGGGLGWLLIVVGQPNWLGSTPLDLILPEGFTFLVLFGLPHIALARTLLLVGVLALLRAWEAIGQSGKSWVWWSAATGAAWFAMGVIVPFYVGVAWAVSGTIWVVKNFRERRVLWAEAAVVGIAVTVSAPVIGYSLYVFSTQPVYTAWSGQNLILSPHPLHYVAASILPILMAIPAIGQVWRADGPGWMLLAWIGVVPLLVYLPVNVQRRLAEGVQIPLYLLAVTGWQKLPVSATQRRAVGAVLLVVMCLTNGLLIGASCLSLRGQPAPIYHCADEVSAMDWLAGRANGDDVVLASYETGNYLPVRAGMRVFVGHGPESVDCGQKMALVERFFDDLTSDSWRKGLLAEYGVGYVFVGPRERQLGKFDSDQATYLLEVYRVDEYVVYEVAL